MTVYLTRPAVALLLLALLVTGTFARVMDTLEPVGTASTPEVTAAGVSLRTRAAAGKTKEWPMAFNIPAESLKPVTDVDAKAASGKGFVSPSSDAQPKASPAGAEVTSQVKTMAVGTSDWSYEESRFGNGVLYSSIAARRGGRLRVKVKGKWMQCTAAVINRALLVTAAHCLCAGTDAEACWPDKNIAGEPEVTFEPGLDGSIAPLGRWSAKDIIVPKTLQDEGGEGYYMGGDILALDTDNDIALIWLKPLMGMQIGDVTGWFGYGTTYRALFPHEFGYNALMDGGKRLQSSTSPKGSLFVSNVDDVGITRHHFYIMKGGTPYPGAPWVANYGIDADISPDAPAGFDHGMQASRNLIMGVTMGSRGDDLKWELGTYFGTTSAFSDEAYGGRGPGNIGALMYDACDNEDPTTAKLTVTASGGGAWKLATTTDWTGKPLCAPPPVGGIPGPEVITKSVP